MKRPITSPHDRFFARIFSERQTAVDFLGHYLPQQVLESVDLGSVEIAKDSFVDEELKGSLSDMLYRVRIAGSPAYIYLLFEHKSYQDPLACFQLLKYMVRIWDLHLKQHGGRTLPLIVPLLIYHGVRKWKEGESFGRLVPSPGEAFDLYVPDFRFLLYDLSSYTDEEIRGEVLLRVTLLVLKHVFRKDLFGKLESMTHLLDELAKKQSGIEYLEVVIRYLAEGAEKLSKDDLLKVISGITVGDKLMPTIAQQWKEEGRQEGLREGLIMVRQMLIEDLEEQYGLLPSSLVEKIGTIQSHEVLRMLRRRRRDCATAADFEQVLEKTLH